MVRGLLITLEGIDGSGKSTAGGILASRLKEAVPYRRFVFTAEPTNGEVGKILRQHLSETLDGSQGLKVSQIKRLEELFLFLSDHADHLSKTVIPALQEGAVVISDRYSDSTAAYQGATLQGIVNDPMNWISNICRPWNISPDLTIIFSVDPAISLKRIKSRSSTEKFERADFLREVDGNFRRMAESDPERFVLLDASRKIDDVAEDALSLIIKKIEIST